MNIIGSGNNLPWATENKLNLMLDFKFDKSIHELYNIYIYIHTYVCVCLFLNMGVITTYAHIYISICYGTHRSSINERHDFPQLAYCVCNMPAVLLTNICHFRATNHVKYPLFIKMAYKGSL